MIILMFVASTPIHAAGAVNGTLNLSTKKLTVPKGKTTAIAKNTVTMVRGCKYQVKIKFGKTYVRSQAKWRTSRPSIVAVSNTGILTAKTAGTTTLKIRYKSKTKSVRIRVVNTHTHTWKTLKEAICETRGKALCTACGLTKSVKGRHNYVTVNEMIFPEGRGERELITAIACPTCHCDMTTWTEDQRTLHISGMTDSCAGADHCSSWGIFRYNKYIMRKHMDNECKDCGQYNAAVRFLYECTESGDRIPDGADPWAWAQYDPETGTNVGLKVYDTTAEPAAKKASKAIENINNGGYAAVSANILTDVVISDNCVSDNGLNTDITVPDWHHPAYLLVHVCIAEKKCPRQWQ